MSPVFSLHAFAETREMLAKPASFRLLLGEEGTQANHLFGGPADIAYRSKLQGAVARRSRPRLDQEPR